VSLVRRPGLTVDLRARRVLRHLAAAAPFELDQFRACLQRHSGRPVHLVPASLPAGSPSGVCCRTASTDYLYYEVRTSPFHQAHILVCLAAHVILDGEPQPWVDPRLIPDVSPQLAELMLGAVGCAPVGDQDAEAFAVRALDRAGVLACPPSVARWFLRQLDPLHAALLHAVPEAARHTGYFAPGPARVRLHRRVVEIRDAALALRPYRTQRAAADAAAVARAAGLAGEPYAACVEAGALAAAIAARKIGPPRVSQPEDIRWRLPYEPRADLRSEAGWLARVSRAFTRLSPMPAQPATRWPHGLYDTDAPSASEDGTGCR
jgi:hypothetical protein